MSATPDNLLDDAAMADLFVIANDAPGRAQLQELFRAFLADAQQELGGLVPGEDLTALRARLHRLKGMMGNYGFAGCAGFISRWENEVSAGDHEERRREVLELLDRTRGELFSRYPWMR